MIRLGLFATRTSRRPQRSTRLRSPKKFCLQSERLEARQVFSGSQVALPYLPEGQELSCGVPAGTLMIGGAPNFSLEPTAVASSDLAPAWDWQPIYSSLGYVSDTYYVGQAVDYYLSNLTNSEPLRIDSISVPDDASVTYPTPQTIRITFASEGYKFVSVWASSAWTGTPCNYGEPASSTIYISPSTTAAVDVAGDSHYVGTSVELYVYDPVNYEPLVIDSISMEDGFTVPSDDPQTARVVFNSTGFKKVWIWASSATTGYPCNSGNPVETTVYVGQFSLEQLPPTGLPTGEALRLLGTGLVSKFAQLSKEQSSIQKRYAKMGVSWPAANPQLPAASAAFSKFYKTISPVLSGKRSSVVVGNGAIFSTSDVESVERVLSYVFRPQNSNFGSVSSLAETANTPVRAQQQGFWDILLKVQPASKTFEELKGLAKQKIDATWQDVKDRFTEGAKVVTGLFSAGSSAAVTEQVRNSIANEPGRKSDSLSDLMTLRQELIESQVEKFDALTTNAGGTAAGAVDRLEQLIARGGDINNILMEDIVRIDAIGRNQFASGTWFGSLSRDGLSGDIFIRFKTQGTLVTGNISHTFFADGTRSRTTGRFEGFVDEEGYLRGSAVVRNSSGSGLFTIKWGNLFFIEFDDYRPVNSFGGLLYEEDRIQFNVNKQ